MSDRRRFQSPLSHLRQKASRSTLNAQASQISSPVMSRNSIDSFDRDDTITALSQGHMKTRSGDHSAISKRPSHDATEADVQKALAALARDMSLPSKNNFARSSDDFHLAKRSSFDMSSSPVVEYDLGEGFFAGTPDTSNAHRRNQSSESSHSSRWWKLSRMRHHNKTSSSSTHPTIDSGRAVSSRSSSVASLHGPELDARSSTTSFAHHQQWLERQSPTASPQPDMFMFPKPQIPQYSQSSLELRQAYSRDGHKKPNRVPSLHSTQSSMSSLGHSRQKSAQSLESPTRLVLPTPDKWSMQLGHANYTIYPEPYTLACHDLPSWQHLLEEYEAAQSEYCKHKARTIEHYGINTETFRLTELKWADINIEWEQSINSARRQLLAQGLHPAQLGVSSAAQPLRMPVLNPHIDGKFPKLGDEDIVGPMAQSEPLCSREPSPARKSTTHKWKLFHKPGSQF